MRWWELSIQVPLEYVEPVSYLFDRYGFGVGLESVDDDQILMKTYIPFSSRKRLAMIEIGINLIRTIQPFEELKKTELIKNEWETAWKAYFDLQKIGKRTVIRPSWVPYTASLEEIVLELDPGMAFGTGYHPTTRLCLQVIEELVGPNINVLDFGTGSGILSIAAAKFGAERVMAIDKDAVATKTAKINIKANKVSDRIVVRRGSMAYVQGRESYFDLVVSNISAKVIKEQASNFFDALKPNGTAIVSGFVEDQQESVQHTMTNVGFQMSRIITCEEWILLQFFRS